MVEQIISHDTYQEFLNMRISSKPYVVYTPKERRVPRRISSCQDCIGSCCMLTRINALSVGEFEHVARVTYPVDILGQIDFQVQWPLSELRYPYLALTFVVSGLLNNPYFRAIMNDDRPCSITPATACGHLKEDGHCGSYEARPRTCHEFRCGCDICRKIYIGKGSKPAIAYGEALNVGEQVLGIVDPLYKPRVFNFTSIK